MVAALETMVETVDMEEVVAAEEDMVMATRAVVMVVAAAATAVVAIMTITTMAMETLEVVSKCQSEFLISKLT